MFISGSEEKSAGPELAEMGGGASRPPDTKKKKTNEPSAVQMQHRKRRHHPGRGHDCRTSSGSRYTGGRGDGESADVAVAHTAESFTAGQARTTLHSCATHRAQIQSLSRFDPKFAK